MQSNRIQSHMVREPKDNELIKPNGHRLHDIVVSELSSKLRVSNHISCTLWITLIGSLQLHSTLSTPEEELIRQTTIYKAIGLRHLSSPLSLPLPGFNYVEQSVIA